MNLLSDQCNKPSLMISQLWARYRQVTQYYLNQSWPSSLTPNGNSRSQWFNLHCVDIPPQHIYYLNLVSCDYNASCSFINSFAKPPLKPGYWSVITLHNVDVITYPWRIRLMSITLVYIQYTLVRHCWTNVNLTMNACILTHWDRDKTAVISQTTFSNAFSWTKMYKFHLSLLVRVQWTLFQHCFRH